MNGISHLCASTPTTQVHRATQLQCFHCRMSCFFFSNTFLLQFFKAQNELFCYLVKSSEKAGSTALRVGSTGNKIVLLGRDSKNKKICVNVSDRLYHIYHFRSLPIVPLHYVKLLCLPKGKITCYGFSKEFKSTSIS